MGATAVLAMAAETPPMKKSLRKFGLSTMMAFLSLLVPYFNNVKLLVFNHKSVYSLFPKSPILISYCKE